MLVFVAHDFKQMLLERRSYVKTEGIHIFTTYGADYSLDSLTQTTDAVRRLGGMIEV